MSEEFRHATIGTDITVKGLDKLNDANSGIDKLQKKAKDFAEYMAKLKDSFGFMGNVKRDADENTSSFQRMQAQMMQVQRVVQQVKGGFDTNNRAIIGNIEQMKKLHQETMSFNSQSIDKVNQSLKQSSEATKQTTELVKKLHEEISQVRPNGFDETKGGTERLKGSIDETNKSTHRLRDTAVGTFVGGMLSNGISSITSGLKAATVQGFQFASAGADVTKKWHSAGLNDNQTNSMIAQMKDIRTHADIAAGSIVAMQKKYLGMTGGDVGKAQQLTSSVTAFSRDSQMNDRQQKMLDRMMTSSKINAGMFTKTISSGPLREELVKMSGMTNQAFTNMVNSGKFTGQQLTDLMVKASKDSGKAWNDYLKTDQGKADMFKSTVADTKKAFDTNVSSKMFESIQKIVGNGKDLKEVQNTVKGIATSLGAKIGDGIGHVVTFITKNEGTLKSIGSSVWQIVKAIGSGVWDTFKGILNVISGNSGKAKSGLKGVSDALSSIAKHKDALETVGKVIAGIFVASKVKAFGGAIKDLSSPITTSIGNTVKLASAWKRFGSFTKAFKLVHPTAFKSLGLAKSGILKVGGAIKTVGSYAMLGGSKILSMVKSINIAKIATKAWSGVTKAFTAVQAAFNFVLDANPIGAIILGVTALATGLYELYKHCKPFREFVNWLGKGALGIIKKVVDFCKPAFKAIGKVIGGVAKAGKKTFKDMWSGMKTYAKDGQNNLKNGSKVFADVFKGHFSDLKKDVPKLLGGMFKTIKDIFKSGFNVLDDLTGGSLSKITDVIKKWGSAIGNVFKGIWNGIKNIVHDAWSGIINIINTGIKGIDWVVSKVGGPKQAIAPIHFANGTDERKKITKPTLAMLNDGHDSPETNNREMAILPSGHAFIPKQRNWKGILPAGTEVLTATETKLLMMMKGIKHFASGTGVMNKVKHTAGNLWSGAKNIAGNIYNGAKKAVDVIAHPIEAIKNAFGSNHTFPGIFNLVGGNVIKMVTNTAISWFKKKFGDMIGGSANPGGSGVKRWRNDVIKVLRALHLSDSEGMVNKVLTQINTESGGNPNAVGGTDGLSDGRAMGLMQVKPGTFAAYAKKGLGNWSNGLASIYAGLNYAKHRYGDNLSFLGQGHGYANGGWSDKPAVFGEAKGEPEVAINPKRDSADRLIKEVVNARSKHNPSIKNMFNNSKSSKPVKVDYHPTININGKGKTDKQALHEALEDNRDELMNMLKQAFCNDDGEGGIII